MSDLVPYFTPSKSTISLLEDDNIPTFLYIRQVLMVVLFFDHSLKLIIYNRLLLIFCLDSILTSRLAVPPSALLRSQF